MTYRGRIAPSPTGYLHVGHARTFWVAQQRARDHDGVLVLRNEDLDPTRSRPEFTRAMIEDLKWFGFAWHEGPDVGGPFAPYEQSLRLHLYRAALEKLIIGGFVYPCTCSRKDIQQATQAPHAADDELIYPGTCRAKHGSEFGVASFGFSMAQRETPNSKRQTLCSWRFRVPDGESISFIDARCGAQSFVAGKNFGDFVVWRHDGVPSYQLAVVVDDAAMRITEVVRGADLLISTARQLLLCRALTLAAPVFFHCPLVTDEHGERLAKRHQSSSLRALRASGKTPTEIREAWFAVRDP